MKIDILETLVDTMDLSNVLIKPENVLLRIEGKGDLKSTFPIPDCDNCAEKCCPPRVAISLYDVARFIDMGMDDYITGKFEGYVALHLSDDGGKDIKLSYSYMNPTGSDAKDCVFLNGERKCNIYDKWRTSN